ncbi:hypothetical protein FF100_03360 [Methylobacterium terricola]|uniref:YCII-related domain-containing protein n=1 Tax=Methylobacterium terricola TaxID=2583531 RepID=A0A5C4LRB5_9HYPH|nr:YciI family protein [Methylobacterium terricola]TNC16305.1 hypothetical protein FF100_03360 [Methylobacterium terricola]
MKHFIIEATYLVPFDAILPWVARHREILRQGYDRGGLLCSGPKDPPVGGYLVARAETRADLESLFEAEPFYVNGVARFTFTEFQPVMRQDWCEHWFSGESR